MAENSDFRKGPAVIWKTEKATEKVLKMSSDFSLLGTTWQLQMHMDYVSFHGSYRYKVYLHRRGSIKPETPFSVITSVQCPAAMKDNFSFQSHNMKTKVVGDVTVLWACYTSTASKEITEFKRCADVTVICVFTDIPSSVSEILNETVEVTTQTDFDRSLSVKKLYDAKSSSDANLDSLSQDLCKLLEDKAVPDINLRCGDRTVAAHKAILAARSPVFAAMFQSQMSESETGVVDITDVDAEVLEMFLKYVYSGRLSDLSDEDLQSLYAAGNKYDVRALKTTCSERMVGNLSRENCLNIFLLANAHGDKDFENSILEFILNQMDILKSQEWMKFRKENPTISNEVLQFVVERKWF